MKDNTVIPTNQDDQAQVKDEPVCLIYEIDLKDKMYQRLKAFHLFKNLIYSYILKKIGTLTIPGRF